MKQAHVQLLLKIFKMELLKRIQQTKLLWFSTMVIVFILAKRLI